MFVWGPNGQIGRHTFYKNNEMAGYCAVLHALQLKGIDGHYGNQRKTIIFSFGAVSRGAIYALKAHGFRDITICIQRPDHEVREEVLDCHYIRIREGNEGEARMLAVERDGSERPLSDLISESDQQRPITQAAIDRKLTLIAFEDMFVWGPNGQIGRHTFYKNNEMAGYCAVIHALQLKGIDGHYGNQRKTIIFSFGCHTPRTIGRHWHDYHYQASIS